MWKFLTDGTAWSVRDKTFWYMPNVACLQWLFMTVLQCLSCNATTRLATLHSKQSGWLSRCPKEYHAAIPYLCKNCLISVIHALRLLWVIIAISVFTIDDDKHHLHHCLIALSSLPGWFLTFLLLVRKLGHCVWLVMKFGECVDFEPENCRLI